MQGLGVKEYHRSCTDNLHEGLKEIGIEPPEVPSPFNLWMNVPWTEVRHFSLSKLSHHLIGLNHTTCCITVSKALMT